MSQGRPVLILFIIVLIFSTNVFAGKIYKWTDAEGNVHFGERPPDSGASEVRIKQRGGVETTDKPSGKTDPVVDPKQQRDKMIRAMEADRLTRQEKRQERQKQQQDHKMQCARARDRLRQYKAASSLYRLDAEGNRHTLPDSVRQGEITRLQTDINKWCK